MISAAKFGSYVIGSDIDFLMLHGRTKPSRVWQKKRADDENIKANMIQYNLQHLYLDVFVADFSNCPLSDAMQLDAIITDRKFLKILGKLIKISQVSVTKIVENFIHEKIFASLTSCEGAQTLTRQSRISPPSNSRSIGVSVSVTSSPSNCKENCSGLNCGTCSQRMSMAVLKLSNFETLMMIGFFHLSDWNFSSI